MSIPTPDEDARGNTPETATAEQFLSPWVDYAEDPASRPAQWIDPDSGQPFSSYAPDLFSAAESTVIRSSGWTQVQAQSFLAHLDREVIQACRSRDFTTAWTTDAETSQTKPRYVRINTKAMDRCQYAVLTHPQRSAFLVIDIDQPSHSPGGDIPALHPEVFAPLNTLAGAGLGPAWLGINPINGKAQAIWLIDPVYAAEHQTSPNSRLLAVATSELNRLLGGDQAFSHRFSRWPLHRSNDPTAYRWHCQHNQVIRLRDLITEVRHMSPQEATERPERPSQYESGRERIQAAQDARRAAQALHDLSAELPDAAELAPAASGIIDGVRVIWVSEGHAARDETAFRHALATAHQMKQAGQALKDAKIIDAYERGYHVAQAVGANNREPDLPPMRDRLTMARRARGYVTAGVTNPQTRTSGGTRITSAGRKALATLGKRGGKKAAERWSNSEAIAYQTAARAPLAKANQRRSVQGSASRGRILTYASQYYTDTGRAPTRTEIMQETGLSRRMVSYHLAALREAGLLSF